MTTLSIAQTSTPKPQSPQQKKLWRECQDFEGIILGVMYKEMDKSAMAGDPLGNDAASQTYREMLDDELSKNMARAGGIGLAPEMYRQMVNQVS